MPAIRGTPTLAGCSFGNTLSALISATTERASMGVEARPNLRCKDPANQTKGSTSSTAPPHVQFSCTRSKRSDVFDPFFPFTFQHQLERDGQQSPVPSADKLQRSACPTKK